MFFRLFSILLVGAVLAFGLPIVTVLPQLAAQDFFDEIDEPTGDDQLTGDNDSSDIFSDQREEPANNVFVQGAAQQQQQIRKDVKPALPISSGVSVGSVPNSHNPISTKDAFSLLDKAEALLAADKKEMSPLEMIKAAYILLKHGDEKQSNPQIKRLLSRFGDQEVTDRELFDIADQLGGPALAEFLALQSLAPENGAAIDKILEGYKKHLKQKDAVESVLLWRDITDPFELLETAMLLSKTGRKEVAGVLIKKFLDSNPTQQQLAEISEKLGSEEIILLLNNPVFEPQGQAAAKLIIEGTLQFNGNNTLNVENENGDENLLLKNDLLARDEKIQAEVEKIELNTDITKLEAVLLDAIKNDKNEEAVAAIVQLGKIGDADSVLYPKEFSTPQKYVRILPRPLIQALTAGDPDVRAAALEVVMKFEPKKPYAGSSLVTDALIWFSRSQGKKIALVAAPQVSQAQNVAGYLIQLGYTPKIATSCAEVLQEAANSPDVELVVVDSRCKSPSVPVFVQQMREGYRTRNIPIAIFSTDEEQLKNVTQITTPLPLMSEAERKRSNTSLAYSLAMVLPYPSNVKDAQWLINLLHEKTGAKAVPQEKRLEISKQALKWLTDIQRKRNEKKLPAGMYNIENLEQCAAESAYSPFLAEDALPLVAQIGSNRTQQLLVDYALTNSIPFNIRQVAANAFIESVELHGVLLKGKQVQRLFDLLSNQYDTGTPDPLLDQIVRKIESKTATKR